MEYTSIILYILVQCMVPAKLSAHLPDPYLVILFLAVTQVIHCGTYIASHLVGHDVPESH